MRNSPDYFLLTDPKSWTKEQVARHARLTEAYRAWVPGKAAEYPEESPPTLRSKVDDRVFFESLLS